MQRRPIWISGASARSWMPVILGAAERDRAHRSSKSALQGARAVLKDVTFVEDMNEVATGCDALVVATEWNDFKKLDLDRARKALSHPILFDGRNLFDPAEMEKIGFIYKSIGR